MAILKLVEHNNPILKTELPVFDFANPPTDPVQLSRDLAETMIASQGMGLAANQCGLPYRVFVLTGEQILACFNPKIVSYSETEVFLLEGCLSYPGLTVKIKRPEWIRARFTMPNGETVVRRFEGLTARCFQHELDHLNGVVHMDRVHLLHKEKAMNDWKQLQRLHKKTQTPKIIHATT